MSVLSSLARRHTALSGREIEHLHHLVADWQLLADLNFADLLLFGALRDREAYVVLAQVRPYPAQTLYQEDMVGTIFEARDRERVRAAFDEGRIVREGDPEWREGIPIREEAIPVSLDGAVIAVISAEQNLATARTPSQLELSYLQAAGDLEQMTAEGVFPFPSSDEREISPRVGDGFMRLDSGGVIAYASPNAVSAYRRLGVTANLVGEHIAKLDFDEVATLESLKRGRPVEDEIDASGAWVYRRFIPIIHAGEVTGAIGILRDITELRHRDRMLLLKDATIREIHHRVKNNLQTVASLLRLQGRRLSSVEAKAALEESVRRISSIALVHETLSQDSHERVDFDHVANRVVEMIQEGFAVPERPIRFRIDGRSGDLPSEVATPLALIIAELIQNAFEHAFGTESRMVSVTVEMARRPEELRLRVSDDGVGLPPGFVLERDSNLGLQIVRTLVESELLGTIGVTGGTGGTQVEVVIPIARARLEGGT
ncbi:MAG: PAS domain-containing sensor histidine kinase [Actinomycetota bacterium]